MCVGGRPVLIVSFVAESSLMDFLGRQGEGSRWRHAGPRALVLADSSWQPGSNSLLGIEADVVDRRRAVRLEPKDIELALERHGASILADWAPPFRLAWQKPDGPVCVGADSCGLGHWFVWQGDGLAVASSSAAAIGRLFGLSVDTCALAGLALTGAMLEEASPIAGVRKVPAGQIAVLRNGVLTFERQAQASLLSGPECALQSAVGRLMQAYPDSRLELSGGWDSRLLTALVQADGQRCDNGRPREGFTIGRDVDCDVILARKVASLCRIDHWIISPFASRSDSDYIFSLVQTAASRDDYASNPLDRAILNDINSARGPGPRLNGQNGEFLRGFYYPGQPLDAAPSATLARRLISWRLICNDRVDPLVFEPSWYADASHGTQRQLEAILVNSDASNWADALDRFYLEQRMQRWFGTAASASLSTRPLLSPFFDADVLAAGRATSAQDKANCRFVARKISALRPDLAALPVNNAQTPAEIAQGGWRSRLSTAQSLARKAAMRALQKLRGSDRATMGSGAILDHIREQGLLSRIDRGALMATGMFNEERLERICSGGAPVSRATAGFLMNTNFLMQRLAQGRA